MIVSPIDPAENPSVEALGGLLEESRAAAARDGRARLVSISLEVDALDPLAVLESIFEPSEQHFYAERPAEGFAVAGAETALRFSADGEARFAACQTFLDETLAHTVLVGDQTLPFAGPHFFATFTFSDTAGDTAAFHAAEIFVPRWQVAHRDGRTVAVANVPVNAHASVGALAERVWRAHHKFRAFDYRASPLPGEPRVALLAASEVGGEGGYQIAVAQALERIGRGDLQKVVLARAKDLAVDRAFHPLEVLNVLRQRFPDCFAFSVANGRGQSFIGASPERLMRLDRGRLITEALAGSIRRGTGASQDAALANELLQSEKDLREHRIVLDALLERLTKLGLALEAAPKPILRRFANVQHLHTPVRSTLPQGVAPLDVLACLHPTPAVGGMPQPAALEEIRRQEPFSRGLYAGTLGWIDGRGNADFFVGLRSALIDGNRARLFAGAGVVAGSVPEKEFAETELKFKAMQDALLSA